MISDLFASIRYAFTEAVRELKRRRRVRKYRDSINTPFDNF